MKEVAWSSPDATSGLWATRYRRSRRSSRHGAVKVLAYCTHAVLSGNAVQRISNSALDELVVTDTIPLREDAKSCGRIRVLSVASLLAETMRRISADDSVSSLFVE